MDVKPDEAVHALVLFLLVLNIKIPETSASVPNSFGGSANKCPNFAGNKSIAFDWIPPNVPEDVVSCMQFKRCGKYRNTCSCTECM